MGGRTTQGTAPGDSLRPFPFPPPHSCLNIFHGVAPVPQFGGKERQLFDEILFGLTSIVNSPLLALQYSPEACCQMAGISQEVKFFVERFPMDVALKRYGGASSTTMTAQVSRKVVSSVQEDVVVQAMLESK